jgi:hypothetical protein
LIVHAPDGQLRRHPCDLSGAGALEMVL